MVFHHSSERQVHLHLRVCSLERHWINPRRGRSWLIALQSGYFHRPSKWEVNKRNQSIWTGTNSPTRLSVLWVWETGWALNSLSDCVRKWTFFLLWSLWVAWKSVGFCSPFSRDGRDDEWRILWGFRGRCCKSKRGVLVQVELGFEGGRNCQWFRLGIVTKPFHFFSLLHSIYWGSYAARKCFAESCAGEESLLGHSRTTGLAAEVGFHNNSPRYTYCKPLLEEDFVISRGLRWWEDVEFPSMAWSDANRGKQRAVLQDLNRTFYVFRNREGQPWYIIHE